MLTWRKLIQALNPPIAKPTVIEPLRLVHQFEAALETGSLVVPAELAQFSALYQEQMGVKFTQVEYVSKTTRSDARLHDQEADTTPEETAEAARIAQAISIQPSALGEQAVLIPFTGGFSSTAAVWQALRQGRQAWLFYLEGFSKGEAHERPAIRETVLQARDLEGCPLLYRLDEKLLSRLLTLPAAQPAIGRQDQLWHPHDLISLYVQVCNVMQAHGISTVLWSGFYEQRPMLTALATYFERYGHTAEYGPSTRLQSWAELLQAQQQSTLTEAGGLTAGPTLGPNLLQRCSSCSELEPAELTKRQQQVPSPLSSVCGCCAQCRGWIDLCVESTNGLPAQRMVLGFGQPVAPPAKPKAKRSRKADQMDQSEVKAKRVRTKAQVPKATGKEAPKPAPQVVPVEDEPTTLLINPKRDQPPQSSKPLVKQPKAPITPADESTSLLINSVREQPAQYKTPRKRPAKPKAAPADPKAKEKQ